MTVKRRFAWVEGCVPATLGAQELEAMFLSVPDVERVLVNVMRSDEGKPPYALLNDKQK